MKNPSMGKMVKAAGDSRAAAKMKSAESPMKMGKKSPMEKELVGKQNNLPPELKAKIEAAPAKMRSRKGAVDTESPMKATDAELMAADKAKLNKGARQQDGKGKTDKERSATPKLDRSKAKRNDPDDGVVSASEASGGMFMKKSPVKKDLPEVTVTATRKKLVEKGRNEDGTVDKTSQRYKNALAAAKRKKNNEAKQKALDKKDADGLDNLSFADRTNLSQQNKTKTTKFTKKAISSTESGSKSPAKRVERAPGIQKTGKAKKRVESAKSTVKAYVEPGKTKKLGGSIYQEKYEGTGETKYSKKAGRKIAKAEKKITQAEKAILEGKLKKAGRKSGKAIKKSDKAINTMGKGGSGRTTRSVQDKYKDK